MYRNAHEKECKGRLCEVQHLPAIVSIASKHACMKLGPGYFLPRDSSSLHGIGNPEILAARIVATLHESLWKDCRVLKPCISAYRLKDRLLLSLSNGSEGLSSGAVVGISTDTDPRNSTQTTFLTVARRSHSDQVQLDSDLA